MATINIADLYGGVGNKVQPKPEEPTTQKASGGVKVGAEPAISWLGLIILLIIARVLYEYGE